MAKITINPVSGAWLDKKVLKTGDVLKLVTEAQEMPSQQGGMQIVAKALVKGGEKEAKNIAVNKPSALALTAAFGDDSINWMDKYLTAHIEKTVVGGKRGIALYLIPEGFEIKEDAAGYLAIVKVGSAVQDDQKMDYPDEINPEDIPF